MPLSPKIKKHLYSGFGILSSFVNTKFLVKRTGQTVILPFYHTVSDTDLPHIKHLYTCKNVTDFKKDLDFLLKNFRPIDLFELISWVKGEKELKDPCFFLSFDDGLREFGEIIAPILKEKGIPATCFLNAAFIDNHELFYRYKASLLIERFTDREGVKLLQSHEVRDWFRDNHLDKNKFKGSLLKFQYSDNHLLDELATLVGVDFSSFLKTQQPYLSTMQIRDLIDQGFTFGSHSIDHPEYRFLSLKEQIRQTVESLNYIVQIFGIKYRVFSFPFTDEDVSLEYFRQVNKQVQPDLSFGGAGIKNDPVKINLQRIPMEEFLHDGKRRIKSDYLYYLLKQRADKNHIKRI